MSTHTPGPWVSNGSLITNENNRHVALVLWRKSNGAVIKGAADMDRQAGTIGEHDANAQLIAAAPDLLAAGEAVLDAWEHGDLAAAVRTLSEAINKAKG